MALVRWVLIVVRLEGQRRADTVHHLIDLLGQPGECHVPGAKGDLAALVEHDRRVFVAEDPFGTVLVIQTTEPKL